MSNYHKLYTPADSAVVFIDHQPQMLFGVANADRATLINNVTLLAKVAKEYKVPAVLTAVGGRDRILQWLRLAAITGCVSWPARH
jgi:nicotinamidase-related amidase